MKEIMQYVRKICEELNYKNFDKLVELVIQKEPDINPLDIFYKLACRFTRRDYREWLNIPEQATKERIAKVLRTSFDNLEELMREGVVPSESSSGCLENENLKMGFHTKEKVIFLNYQDFAECLELNNILKGK